MIAWIVCGYILHDFLKYIHTKVTILRMNVELHMGRCHEFVKFVSFLNYETQSHDLFFSINLSYSFLSLMFVYYLVFCLGGWVFI